MNHLTLTKGQLNNRTHRLDSRKTAALMTDGQCYEWNGATPRWEFQAILDAAVSDVISRPIILAHGFASVEFRPAGCNVKVIRRFVSNCGTYTLTVDAARREYRKLIAAGYRRW